jgi:hypothetical protein
VKKLIIFIILFNSIYYFSFAQKNDSQLDSLIYYYKVDSISKYYKYVYKAEAFIMKGDFEKAAKTYEKAFTYIDIPFSSDLAHARKCEMDSRKDEDCIKKYIYFSIRKTGMKNGYLNNEELQKLETWPDIKAMIDTLSALNDTTIVNELDRIIFIDQDYRRQCREKFNGNTYNDFTKDSISKIDSVNYFTLLKLFSTLEYVSEEVIGVRTWGTVDIVLAHNRNRFGIYQLLYKSVQNGKLDARLFAYCLNDANYKIANKYPIGGRNFGFQVTHDCYLYFKPSQFERFKINKLRRNMHLESIDNFHKKRIWQLQNKNSGYFFYKEEIIFLNELELYNLIENDIFNGQKVSRVKLFYSNRDVKENMENNSKKWTKNQQ